MGVGLRANLHPLRNRHIHLSHPPGPMGQVSLRLISEQERDVAVAVDALGPDERDAVLALGVRGFGHALHPRPSKQHPARAQAAMASERRMVMRRTCQRGTPGDPSPAPGSCGLRTGAGRHVRVQHSTRLGLCRVSGDKTRPAAQAGSARRRSC